MYSYVNRITCNRYCSGTMPIRLSLSLLWWETLLSISWYIVWILTCLYWWQLQTQFICRMWRTKMHLQRWDRLITITFLKCNCKIFFGYEYLHFTFLEGPPYAFLCAGSVISLQVFFRDPPFGSHGATCEILSLRFIILEGLQIQSRQRIIKYFCGQCTPLLSAIIHRHS